MAIAAISSASVYVPPPPNSALQSFGQLVNAVQAGNLTAAQSAYAAFAQSPAGQSDGPLSQAINQIGNALQSSDIGKAQQTLASLQQQAQSAPPVHHHHGGHHHGGGEKPQSATSPSNTDQSTSPTSTNLVDLTA
jgi:hypothetical protein